LPNANIGWRPIKWLMPSGLTGPSGWSSCVTSVIRACCAPRSSVNTTQPKKVGAAIGGLRLVYGLLQPLFDLAEVERARRLARWIILHCLEELRRESLDG